MAMVPVIGVRSALRTGRWLTVLGLLAAMVAAAADGGAGPSSAPDAAPAALRAREQTARIERAVAAHAVAYEARYGRLTQGLAGWGAESPRDHLAQAERELLAATAALQAQPMAAAATITPTPPAKDATPAKAGATPAKAGPDEPSLRAALLKVYDEYQQTEVQRQQALKIAEENRKLAAELGPKYERQLQLAREKTAAVVKDREAVDAEYAARVKAEAAKEPATPAAGGTETVPAVPAPDKAEPAPEAGTAAPAPDKAEPAPEAGTAAPAPDKAAADKAAAEARAAVVVTSLPVAPSEPAPLPKKNPSLWRVLFPGRHKKTIFEMADSGKVESHEAPATAAQVALEKKLQELRVVEEQAADLGRRLDEAQFQVRFQKRTAEHLAELAAEIKVRLTAAERTYAPFGTLKDALAKAQAEAKGKGFHPLRWLFGKKK